ncbi:MAG: chlorite dismutase family protein [Dehalococcoidia bacterium]
MTYSREKQESPSREGMEEIGKGQYVQYVFYKLDPTWRLLPSDEQAEGKRRLLEVAASFADQVTIRSYSLVGIRAEADFLLWNVSAELDSFQRLATAILSTALGSYLRVAYSYLAVTKRSIYVRNHQHEGQEGTRLRLRPSGARYFFVYPFVKTRAWYKLSLSARQGMMNEHITIGHKYPSVTLNTTYSFGMDDQEFVVAFETDEPRDFVDLVMELRESEASQYTLRDTPIFTGIALPLAEVLETLGGVQVEVPLAAGVR